METRPTPRSRIAAAVAAALVFTAGYILVLYLFVAWLWPRLPDWAVMIAFVLLAIFVIGSPIAALARIGNVLGKRPPGRRDN